MAFHRNLPNFRRNDLPVNFGRAPVLTIEVRCTRDDTPMKHKTLL